MFGKVIRFKSIVVGKAKKGGEWQANAGGIAAKYPSQKDPTHHHSQSYKLALFFNTST